MSSRLNDDGEVDLRIKAAGALLGHGENPYFSADTSRSRARSWPTILAMLFYDSEAWAFNAKSLDKLQRFHRKSTRQMCKVTTEHMWKHHIHRHCNFGRPSWPQISGMIPLEKDTADDWCRYATVLGISSGGPVTHSGRNLKRALCVN